MRSRASLRRFSRREWARTPLGPVTGRVFIDVALILVGTVCMALAVDIFLDPNNVVPGGFTALAIFANRLWGWPVGVTLLIMNVPFLIIGVRVLGMEFGPKTILAATVSALLIDLLRPVLPVVRGEPMLYIVYGGLLYGLGMGLVFRANATSGGTETPAKLLEHYYRIRMSSSLLAMDAVILLIAARLFGLAPALYALIAAWVMARVIDGVEAGFSASDTAFIITERIDHVRSAVMDELERGVTLLQAQGGYTAAPRTVLFTVVSRRQVSMLREIVSRVDPDAFVVISPSSEVLGEGFKPLARGR